MLSWAGSDDVQPTRPGFRRSVYDFLEANTPAGMVLEAITVLLIIVNVVFFMLSTERSMKDKDWFWSVTDVVELCTVSTDQRVWQVLVQVFTRSTEQSQIVVFLVDVLFCSVLIEHHLQCSMF